MPKGDSARARVRVKNAGGLHSRFVLVSEYKPAKGQKKLVQSNHLRYGKSWATKEEINDDDKAAFVDWVNSGFARGGSAFKKRMPGLVQPSLPVRSSCRVDVAVMQSQVCIATSGGELVVEQGVLQCVKALVNKVIHQGRWLHCSDAPTKAINIVAGKPRRHESRVIISPHPRTGITKRLRPILFTHRKSRGYYHRQRKLELAAASRAEDDLEWLEAQSLRLATLLARQSLHELLPEGVAPRT